MTKDQQELSRPWYKEPWMLLVAGLPAVSVLLGIAMLVLSMVGRDTLVRDNYYKDGLAINQELGFETKALELGLSAKLSVDDGSGSVALDLQGTNTPPAKLTLLFLHPTVQSWDQEVVLHRIKDGHYAGNIESSLQGRYHIQLSSKEQQWRLKAYRELAGDKLYALP